MSLTPTSLTMLRATGLTLASALLIGCAQTSAPGYYDPPKASSTQDAIRGAEGASMRQVVTAPSQIQVTWRTGGDDDKKSSPDGLTAAGQADLDQTDLDKDAVNATPIGLITKPETFMGNLPCFAQGMNCSTQRFVLTLAPNGRWRSRITYFEQQQQSGQPSLAQGCWRSTLSKPPSILLLDADKNVRTELRMTANDVLQIVTVDGDSPSLTYTLSRQPDLDSIGELDAKPSPVCR